MFLQQHRNQQCTLETAFQSSLSKYPEHWTFAISALEVFDPLSPPSCTSFKICSPEDAWTSTTETCLHNMEDPTRNHCTLGQQCGIIFITWYCSSTIPRSKRAHFWTVKIMHISENLILKFFKGPGKTGHSFGLLMEQRIFDFWKWMLKRVNFWEIFFKKIP